MRISLSAAAQVGAEVLALSGVDCQLPMYAPEVPMRTPAARALVQLVARCDGIILSSPSYHGSLSGMLKNALDYVEDLREDARPYFEGRAVGCRLRRWMAGRWHNPHRVAFDSSCAARLANAARRWH